MHIRKKSKCFYIYVVIAVIISAVCLFAVGCGPSVTIVFVLPEGGLTLYVGETRDLFPYAEFLPPAPGDKKFVIETDDEIFEVSGTRVTAVGKGAGVIYAIANGKTTEIKITSLYREPRELHLSYGGDIIQTVGVNDASVTFFASTDEYADPDAEIVWSVNGEIKSVGKTFVFPKSDAGEYTVQAECGGIKKSVGVRVYKNAPSVSATYEGELIMSSDRSPVVFRAIDEKIFPNDPRPVFEWTVNGATASFSHEYEFLPESAGRYEIALKVNGVPCEISGENTVAVDVTGNFAPNVTVDADGDVKIKFSKAGTVSSIIIEHNGVRTVCDSSDHKYMSGFKNGEFDAKGLITPAADDPSEYTVTAIGEAAGAPTVFLQYPAEALAYMNDVLVCNNRFLTGTDDTKAFVRELFATGITESTGYLARGFSSDTAAKAVAAAAEELGVGINVVSNGNIVSVTFERGLEIEKEITPSSEKVYSFLPHIAYEARRGDGYVFAVERIDRYAEASNGEQLLICLSNGLRPEPKKGSVAETIFRGIKNSLNAILAEDFTDKAKVHAIYDFLQWNTKKIDDANIESAANYLEGVFGGADFTTGHAVTTRGMAKAFAAMCLAEGIECEIVCGKADGAPYFWNKVRLDRLWYNVDAFGGEHGEEIGIRNNGELGSHTRLLFSDAAAKRFGLISTDRRDAYDDGESFYYASLGSDDLMLDTEDLEGDKIYEMTVAALSGRRTGEVRIQGIGSIMIISCNTLAAEFALFPELSAEERVAAKNAVALAAAEYYEKTYGKKPQAHAITVYSNDECLHLIVSHLN